MNRLSTTVGDRTSSVTAASICMERSAPVGCVTSTPSQPVFTARLTRMTSYVFSLATCRPSGRTDVASGVVDVVVVVVVVIGVCNRSQMSTSKCTCLMFGVSIALDPG